MIFIDSSFLIALFFENDPNHDRARRTWIRTVEDIYISEDILKETLTIVSQRKSKKGCITAYRKIREECTLLPQQPQYFQQGMNLFLNPSLQKDISLIDCISVAICKETRSSILSFDRHFRSLGVNVLPK